MNQEQVTNALIAKSFYKSMAIRAAELLSDIRANGLDNIKDSTIADLIAEIKEATQ